MKLFVGNFSRQMNESGLVDLVSPHGRPVSVTMMLDHDSGTPRGFAFVEFANREEGCAAIAALDGHAVDGRALRVMEANLSLRTTAEKIYVPG